MEEVTLALAILLGTGFVAAKLGQLLRLPSVTGYICAGLLLGPSGLHVVTAEAMGERLDHFTQIALMLIAFGIGEHLELKRLRYLARDVLLVGAGEIFGAFLLVSCGMFLMIYGTVFTGRGWDFQQSVSISLLIGAISIATAPATVLSVLRELRATGPVTSTLLPVVAVNNGVAIIIFGIVLSVVRQMVGGLPGALLPSFGTSLMEICFSLFMGLSTGMLIDFIVNRLRNRGEMLTFGLAALLLCGELARHFGLSHLLAGMAAGFCIVNRDHRDVRLFRALNAFEAPIYVLFFTLAGANLQLKTLAIAGWIGVFYFCLRGLGKITGANLGGRIANTVVTVHHYLGWALLPQAGVAIGLVLLIQSFPELHAFSAIITPVVLAGVFLAELIGPLSVRLALEKAGETVREERMSRGAVAPWQDNILESFEEEVKIVPWTWEKLLPPNVQQGAVLFGTAHVQTIAGLARMATLLAHYHHARPLAVRVIAPAKNDAGGIVSNADQTLFNIERREVENLGYELDTALVKSYDVPSAIVSTARWNDTRCILLGYPHHTTAQGFENLVEQVAREATCQVIVAHFSRVLHTERILVPLISRKDLPLVHNVVCALARVGRHKVTLMRLLSQDAGETECRSAEKNLHQWAVFEELVPYVTCCSFATEARLETILKAAEQHDLIIMASTRPKGLHRLFFGSLADEVARNCTSSMLMVHGSNMKK
jgi:Kef-type K+ transport system membrane component KefB/nucleotide-binding universal stress UspA family protein